MTVALANSRQISVRHLRALARQPYWIAVTLVQPIVWLLLFGELFKRVADLPGFTGASYIAYLTPGIVVMTAVFANGWSGMTYIQDMDRGIMDRFLVSPASRAALIAGGLGYQAVITIIQAVIIIGLGFAVGARFEGGLGVMLVFLLGAVVLGAAFAALSNLIALLVRRDESVVAAVNFLLLPLSFLSAMFLPETLMPGWMQAAARFNPVNWAVEIGRQTIEADVDWALIGTRMLYLALFAGVLAYLSARAFRSYQRSI
ncbi:ABC transporter permease [Asanoa iriomotensis]|uniref:Transport permease protein n=1 Tax=Asanoa iriomotensis TaxID=234613 RepID=A0ABQ4C2A6_9ACTN|nr:ABC transporter permease [Asanoa iriomotensis]GIF56425.1 transport permease protein [Asanoa iriomotensis]